MENFDYDYYFYWFGYDLPIKERYWLIKEAGVDGILLWWSDYYVQGYIWVKLLKTAFILWSMLIRD
ncbi:MAG TPA: hypothetical protein DCP51_10615 [Clostridiales bacterium]|nr:hypothetical protein [Clostridiales bacterium]